MDWCLQHMREIESEAAAAARDETPSDWKIRKSPGD